MEHLKYLTGELKIANSNIAAQKKRPKRQEKKGKTESNNVNKMVLKFTDDSVFLDNPS